MFQSLKEGPYVCSDSKSALAVKISFVKYKSFNGISILYPNKTGIE